MPRVSGAPGQVPGAVVNEMPRSKPVVISRPHDSVGTFWDMLAVRVIFAAVCTAAGYHFRPFSLPKIHAGVAGFLFAVAIILFEIRLRKASLRRLIGAATGSILGILGAFLISLIFTHTTMPESTRSFFSLSIFLLMAYIGLVLGANKGDMLNLQALGIALGHLVGFVLLRYGAGY